MAEGVKYTGPTSATIAAAGENGEEVGGTESSGLADASVEMQITDGERSGKDTTGIALGVGVGDGDGNVDHHQNTTGDGDQSPSGESLALVPTYRVYKWRWYIVGTLAVLNISNAMAWICFAAVTNFTASYFEVSVDAVNWFSLIYLIVAVPMGFVVAWQLDTYGFRLAILLGAWFNFVGILLRFLAVLFPVAPPTQYAIAMVGQTLAAIGQPFLLFSPTKMAALWFSEDQRALANMLGSMSNPLGILLSFLVSALVVSSPDDIPTLLWILIIPAGIGVTMATLGVCSSTPPTPPSRTADGDHETFKEGLKMLIRNRKFWILFVTFGAGYGIFNAISTFLEQIVCPVGYDDNFAGLIGALMIGVGLLGALVAGIIADKTKAFTLIVKVCYSCAVVFVFVFSISSKFNKAGAGLLIGGIGFGMFGLAQFAIILELGVECSYPVAEGTSACILQVSGQLQGIILIILGQVLAQSISITNLPNQQCIDVDLVNATALPTINGTTPWSTTPLPTTTSMGEAPSMTSAPVEASVLDMTIPLFVFASYGLLNAIILVIFFSTRYLRLEAETGTSTAKETGGKCID